MGSRLERNLGEDQTEQFNHDNNSGNDADIEPSDSEDKDDLDGEDY